MATINGTSGNDTLRGGDGDDLLFGYEGADSFSGSYGNDRYDGGAVLDRFRFTDLNSIDYRYLPLNVGQNVDLSGVSGDGSQGHGTASPTDNQPGVDQLVNIQGVLGSYFSDRLIGSSALVPEFFDGGGGNDTIDGGAITDPLGRNGNQLVFNRSYGVNVDLQAGTARIEYFSAAASSLNVRALAVTAAQADGPDHRPAAVPRTTFNLTLANINDVVATGYGDTLLGSNRNDVFEFFAPGGANDTIDGRGGIDIVRYDLAEYPSTTGVIASLASGSASNDGWGGSDSFSNIEGLYGGRFADQLTGADGAVEYFMGNAGNDTIDGGAGLDWALYTLAPAGVSVSFFAQGLGTASDGEGGTDQLLRIEAVQGSAFNDTLIGSASTTLERFAGFASNDSINGGAGPDEANYERSAYLRGIVVDLAQQRASEDGNGGQDILVGIEHVVGSLLYGDNIAGDDGNNALAGSGGNDTLTGRGGNDTLDGGAGPFDVARLGGTAALTLDLGAGTATRGSGATLERDTLIGIEGVFAGDGNDTLIGSPADSVTAYLRDDTLRGSAGDDRIDGLGGTDTAEFTGRRGDYLVTVSNPGGVFTITVTDRNATDGNEGTDTLVNTERVMFGDQQLSFGARAEEIARVAFVLWTKEIVGSSLLFGRAMSYYDVGYDFATMSIAAMQWWRHLSDAQLADQLIVRSEGSNLTRDILLATMAANGGGEAGRAAATRQVALDPATTALIEASGIRTVGLVSDNVHPDFGTLAGLLPG